MVTMRLSWSAGLYIDLAPCSTFRGLYATHQHRPGRLCQSHGFSQAHSLVLSLFLSMCNSDGLSIFLPLLCSSFIFSQLLAVAFLSQPFHALLLYSLSLYTSPAEPCGWAGLTRVFVKRESKGKAAGSYWLLGCDHRVAVDTASISGFLGSLWMATE